MSLADEIKAVVRNKYDSIARGSGPDDTGHTSPEVSCVGDDYTQVRGYVAAADLGLGCGIPTEVARLRQGDTVLDLGAGAGNDCFVARAVVGETGRVIGVDMAEAMIEKARANAERLGFANVEFRHGEIESLPVEADSVDVVISNCVLNLVSDKRRAFSETFRVLKPGGHFSISDIVVAGELPERARRVAEEYAGCVAGAMREGEYLDLISAASFVNVSVARRREIRVPAEVLLRSLTADEARAYGSSGSGLMSVTVYGEKPPHGG